MKINDALSGLLVALFAVAIYVHADTLPAMGQQIGPNVFPQALAAGFMICAALLVLRGLRSLRRGAANTSHGTRIATVGHDQDEGDTRWFSLPPWIGSKRAVFAFLLVPLSLVFYILVSEPLGFLPTAFIVLTVLFLTFRIRVAVALPVAALSALVIHALFYKLLKVPLPWGILQPLAW
ncbi:tripartite tricarboxylate transporter TctB family protein [Herbaspirillum sp. YR522]|uniref:tripartite tricarboxylate transporter TctB family protein n=1 Tax=Herbaspirillum sp. YR522 TaxID=1144342 RepID=UPI00026FC464|nr:tripartite tricarboxylate transporter TctB family protein [Herbaspirillum sp. YR522]EJN09589.1 Tripartite tricarboxylate transporter TctB family [Herbaspirillum sp. YR522]